jgi:DNA helicase-2/ATP-dependent DNA helicase PcrA
MRPTKEKKTISPESSAKPKLMNVSVGDTVEHKVFGRGQVTSVTMMPGDALVSVNFEKAGEKRLMIKTAGAFMKKVSD